MIFMAISQMAEEEDTREVLFTDWQGPDETGLTIEQTSGGDIFVKEVRGESPAARSGKVYKGRGFICFLIVFNILIFQRLEFLLVNLLNSQVTRLLVPLSILTT